MTVPKSQHLRAIGTQVHVFVDGYDVTVHCASADDIQGWAALYVRGGPDVMLVHGVVRFSYDLKPETERHQAQ